MPADTPPSETSRPRPVSLFVQLSAILGSCVAVVSAVYFLERMLRGTPIAKLVEWILWPGVALWFGTGGALFGGGFGPVGDFLVIVAGSAVTWSVVAAVVTRIYIRLRHRTTDAQ